jgi:hypothetical protein
MVSHARAAWSGFANVYRGNESDYDIRVDVSHDDHQRYHYRLTVPMVGEHKQCWLILTKSSLALPHRAFRQYIWDPHSGRTDILLHTPLIPTASHEIQFTIHQDLLSQSYVYIDFPHVVLDGGYYYTIDLSSYVDELQE